MTSVCVLMVQVFKNNLDKRTMNSFIYGKVWCTTQGYEIFRYSARGCLKTEKSIYSYRTCNYPTRACASRSLCGWGWCPWTPKKFEWHFSGRLTFSNTCGRLLVDYRLGLPLRAPDTLSSLELMCTLFYLSEMTQLQSLNSIDKYRHLVK